MVTEKEYKGACELLRLSGSINSSATSFACKVTPSANWPTGSSLPFVITIDRGEATEETLLLTGRSGSNFTGATRGYGGTAAVGHSDDATIEHTTDATAMTDWMHAAANTTGKVTTAGDLLVGSGAGTISRLAKGSNGQILGVASGVVGWGALPDAAISSSTQFGAAVVPSTALANDAVTYAKMQNVSATDRILGRDTAGAGDPEELTVGGGLEFTGSGGIQRSALTGDVTATAGSGATAIGASAVTATHIAAAVAGNGLAGGAGTALSVGVDGSTVEISSDAVRVKDGGITQAKAATGLTFLKGAAGAPSGTTERMWYDSTNNLLYVRNSADAWVCITPVNDSVATAQSTTTVGSYVNLGTVGPTATVVTGTKAVVTVTANLTNSTVGAGGAMSFAVTGASSVAAADSTALFINNVAVGQNFSMSATYYVEGLTAGSNVFTSKYRAVGSGTMTATARHISVVGIP